MCLCLTEQTMARANIGRKIEMLAQDGIFLITLPLRLRVLPCIVLLRPSKCQIERRYRTEGKKIQRSLGQPATKTTKNALGKNSVLN